MSKKKAKDLLKAHVKHEMDLLTGKNLAKGLKDELAAAYDWFKDLTVEDLAPKAKCIEDIKTRVVNGPPIPDEIKSLARDIGKAIYEYLKENEVKGSDLLPKDIFDQATEQTDSQRKIREKVVHEALNMSLYGRLISDVLYTSIKEFMLENPMAKRIPGASKFMKMSQEIISQSFGGMEAQVEKQIKTFIEKQIKTTVKQSEDFLNRGLDSDLYDIVIDEIWESLSEMKLAGAMAIAGEETVDEIEPVIDEFIRQFREKPLFFDLLNVGVDIVYDTYGERDLQSLLKEQDWSQKKFVDEAARVMLPAIEKAVSSGFLKKRITARLEAFYSSKAALSILGS